MEDISKKIVEIKSQTSKWYGTIDKRIAEGEYGDASVTIRHVLELVLKTYVAFYLPEAKFLDMFKKIVALEEAGIIDSASVHTLHGIRKLTNKGAHIDRGEVVTRDDVASVIPALKKEVGKLLKYMVLVTPKELVASHQVDNKGKTPLKRESKSRKVNVSKYEAERYFDVEDKNRTVYYKSSNTQRAALLILEKEKAVRVVSLSGRACVGRNSEEVSNDIVLSSSIVSRKHGEFLYDEITQSHYYKDCNSLNGTYINGTKLEVNGIESKAVRLMDGDVIRVDRRELNNPHPEAVVMVYGNNFSEKDIWQRYSLAGKSVVVVGRNAECDIVLDDFMASREHAKLIREGQMWFVEDNNSINGLAVNKQMIERKTLLHPMDIIRIANSSVIFTGEEIVFCGRYSKDISKNKAPVVMNVNINDVCVRNSVLQKKKMLLKDINLDVNAGDFVLVLGGAGAGKTTFLKSLLGEYRANGEILLEGIDLYRNFKMLKHKIGIVPQFATTRDSDTVYHTIMDAAVSKLSGEYAKDEIQKRVDEVLDKMMLSQLKSSLIKNLSGGQKKRVEVALQSVSDQKIFILDEPDSGMDYASRMDLMRNLKECTSDGNVVAVISHSPDEPADLFTKVIVLAKSKEDQVGHLAYYGDVKNAYSFFGVTKLSEIVMEINYEGGHGKANEFIEKFEKTRRG